MFEVVDSHPLSHSEGSGYGSGSDFLSVPGSVPSSLSVSSSLSVPGYPPEPASVSGYSSGYGSEYSGGSSDSGTEFVPRELKKEKGKGYEPALEEVGRTTRRKRATSGLRIHTSRALLPSIYSPKSQSMITASCLAALAILGGALAVLACGFFAFVIDHNPSSCSSSFLLLFLLDIDSSPDLDDDVLVLLMMVSC